jgi:hypothetical protein
MCPGTKRRSGQLPLSVDGRRWQSHERTSACRVRRSRSGRRRRGGGPPSEWSVERAEGSVAERSDGPPRHDLPPDDPRNPSIDLRVWLCIL